MNGKLSIIISVILVTAAAILTVQSSSMLQPSYAQSCPDGSTPDASGNCATMPPPAGGDGETAQAPPATETPPPAAPPANASQGSNNTASATVFINTMLEIHNRERAAVGVPPVTWSDSLATDAQAWADYIVSLNLRWDLCGQDSSQCPFHSSAQQNPNGNGENIAWGGDPSGASQAESWVKEKSNYVPGSPIEPSLGLPDRVYGHYTAMVWSNTTQIGCGIAQQTFPAYILDILVCRYSPGGNVGGQPAYPVRAPPAPATNATTTAAVGEEQNTLCQNLPSSLCHDDQGAVQ
jgi:pathogenesis-related protein 1